MRSFVLLMLLAVAVPARADVFTIPLPGLHGLYDNQTQAGSSRSTTFQLPGLPALVRGARLHLVGTTEIGTMTCGPQQSQYPWNTQTEGMMRDGPNQFWLAEASNPYTAGAFDTNVAFEGLSLSGPSPTWNFLSDGQGDITLYGGTGVVLLGGCSTSDPPPTFTVSGAWIQIDADIPVPAATTSWGAVKAIYR